VCLTLLSGRASKHTCTNQGRAARHRKSQLTQDNAGEADVESKCVTLTGKLSSFFRVPPFAIQSSKLQPASKVAELQPR
jgi:hypothetical protein